MLSTSRFRRLFAKKVEDQSLKFRELLVSKLQFAFPGGVVVQNEPDESDCDISMIWAMRTIHFELAGDTKNLLNESKFFPFGKSSVEKLLNKNTPGFAVYYLGKEPTPRFFFRRADVILEKFEAVDENFHIPIDDWIPFDQFVTKLTRVVRKTNLKPKLP